MAKSYFVALMVPFLLAVCNLSARETTSIESWIQRIKETTTFVPITGIWQPDNTIDETALLQKVSKVSTLVIDYTKVAALVKRRNTAITLVVPGLAGNSYSIDLACYDFFSNDFAVHSSGNKTDEIVYYSPGLYYRGVVTGVPGSVAAFSFFNNEVYGIFSIPGEGNYTLVPNTMAGKYFDNNRHYILYNDNDLLIKNSAPACAGDLLPGLPGKQDQRAATIPGNNVYNNCTEVRVYEVADYATYASKGSSTTNVTNYLTALFNNQSAIYRNEGIPIVLKYIQINTAPDEYQNISSANSLLFLDKFGYVTQNSMHGSDVAMLLSTRYGTMGGVAWLQSMCSSYFLVDSSGPYGFCNIDNSNVVNFPTFSWDVEVTTHEMGHIVGSPHTHRCCWNPPGTGTTAIDGCYTVEGSCPNPGLPAGGGTIMSYCHLTGVGINFANGFGPQPGDTIRYFIAHRFSSTCGAIYNPSAAVSVANRVVSANRECTDMSSGITYYWNDNNTADQTDDTLVLMISKNGNSIGTLNDAAFSVRSGTLPGFGTGSGMNFRLPAGEPAVLSGNTAMRRFWNVAATAAPATPVEVMFPFTRTDTADVDGSVPGATPLTRFLMYKVNSPVDPNPANGLAGATASNVTIYTYGASPSTSTWSFSTIGNTYLAHIKTTNLSGGGSGFCTYVATAQEQVHEPAAISVYPNPASTQWFVSVADNNGDAWFSLYNPDGRLMLSQVLQAGTINPIPAASLPAGIYFYRVICNSNTYTGSLEKR
jgi:hypothetical protein